MSAKVTKPLLFLCFVCFSNSLKVDRKGSQSPIILLSDDEDFEVERDDVGAGCDRGQKE